MDKYEVIFKANDSGGKWSIMVYAATFADAEREANTINETKDEIIQIVRDYD